MLIGNMHVCEWCSYTFLSSQLFTKISARDHIMQMYTLYLCISLYVYIFRAVSQPSGYILIIIKTVYSNHAWYNNHKITKTVVLQYKTCMCVCESQSRYHKQFLQFRTTTRTLRASSIQLYKAEKLSVCLSVCWHFLAGSISQQYLHGSKWFLCQTKHPSSSFIKFFERSF